MKNFAITETSIPMMITDPAAIAAGEAAKARIQSGYIMAYQKPRDPMVSRDNILKACRRSEFAEKAEYVKPVGNKSIKGPSVRFAELALREWGNIMTEVTTLYEDDNIRRVRVSALDLETNAQFTRDVQIKKTIERKSKKNRDDDFISERKNSSGETIYVLRATDEEMYTKESAWVSKVLRNEGLRLIPTDIIEEGMVQARKTIADKTIKDPEGEKKKLLDAFSGIGISPKEIQKYIKHPMDIITPSELINLRVIYQSIRDGESTWIDYTNEKEVNNESEVFDTTEFDRLVSEKTNKYSPDIFSEFIALTAQAQGVSIDELKLEAVKSFDDFWIAFESWARKTEKQQTNNAHVLAEKDNLIKALQEITSLSHLKKWREKNRDEVNRLPADSKKEITSAWLKREADLEYKGKKELEHDQQPEASESLIQADKHFDSIRQKDPVNFDIARINAGIKEERILSMEDFEKFVICYNELTER